MSKDHKPTQYVKSGEIIAFKTYDCYCNKLISENQPIDSIKEELSNPATGPLYIEGAEVGDILKIEIIDIKVNNKGAMRTRPNVGILGEVFKESKVKIIHIEDNKAIFNEKIQIPIKPMIGVIGVAPKGIDVNTMVPDMHGGNMDCKRIVKGAIVYLPVNVLGGLLSIGDLHAIMADGEIVICGLEIDGEVTIRVDVIKNKVLPLPMVVEGDHIMTIASKETLDAAAKQATINMHNFLLDELKMDVHEAGMLLSLVGDLKICQIVDPLMTARMEFPKSILAKYNYKMV